LADGGSTTARSESPSTRLAAAAVGLFSAAAAVALALHHPLWPWPALGCAALLMAAQAWWGPLWLVALPALLPWLGLAPWSGWVMAEEMDVAVLAVAAGAYMRWAVAPGPRAAAGGMSGLRRAGTAVLLLLWTGSVLWAAQRGMLDAGGWSLGWWHGYREPTNALRLAKPTLALLLLLPLWWRLQRQPGQRAADQLTLGLTLCLAGTAAWCVWERMAFPGLLNFSSDYRSTGPFWEMHVGGAALDGMLALTLPFAVRQWWVARTPWSWAGAAFTLLLGANAALTTFSRIVYLAVPAGGLVWLWLTHRQAAASVGAAAGRPAALRPALLLCAGLGVLAALLFPSAGYRGMLALLGNAVLLLWLVPRSVRPHAAQRRAMLALGLPLTALVVAVALQFSKGGYVAYTLVSGLTALALALAERRPPALAVAGAGFMAQLACTVVVGWQWGGAPALLPACVTAAAVALAWQLLGLRHRAAWTPDRRWLGGTVLGMVLVVAGVALFEGGAYMANRLESSRDDGQDRWRHWRDSLARQATLGERLLGSGLGRYADRYALDAGPGQRPGDVRLMTDGAAPAMRLIAGTHVLGNGELLRLSQRIGRPSAAPLTLELQLRSALATGLQVEVCRKHLLYGEGCREAAAATAALPGQWQTVRIVLPAGDEPADAWYATRPSVFSLATTNAKQPVDLRSVVLTDPTGVHYLHNEQFAAGGAFWLMSSDRHHLPWHAKNLVVHLVFEQGLFGLVALLALTATALGRLLGPQRQHPLAPALAAALVGCWVVGAVDSLLDMPRLATWLLLLTGMALSLQGAGRPGTPAGAGPQAPAPAHPLASAPAAPCAAGGRGAAPGHHQPRRRAAMLAALVAVLAPALGAASFWGATYYLGRTADELLDHAQQQLADQPPVLALVSPVLGMARALFGQPADLADTGPFTVPPLPANVAARPPGGGTTLSDHTADGGGDTIIHVGPGRAVTRLSQAAQLARDGSVIEIDPGDYIADVAVWDRASLTLRGRGDGVRLIAGGAHAEGKAIWVVRRGQVTVENITFVGARVPDHNGAGIRLESGQLTVRRCLFYDNESGVLTGGVPGTTLQIEDSEFAYNGAGDGLSHHVYAGAIASLSVTGSYLHHANTGHLVKSRAAQTTIAYNRLTDESGGRASYELEFPNGGRALVIGNLIQQSAQTRNSTIISYGAEGYTGADNALKLSHNTVVNDHPGGGSFLSVAPGADAVLLRNNLWVGRGRFIGADAAAADGNAQVGWDHFVLAARQDYRPARSRSADAPAVRAPGGGDGWAQPQFEYRHAMQRRPLAQAATLAGAVQTLGP